MYCAAFCASLALFAGLGNNASRLMVLQMSERVAGYNIRYAGMSLS